MTICLLPPGQMTNGFCLSAIKKKPNRFPWREHRIVPAAKVWGNEGAYTCKRVQCQVLIRGCVMCICSATIRIGRGDEPHLLSLTAITRSLSAPESFFFFPFAGVLLLIDNFFIFTSVIQLHKVSRNETAHDYLITLFYYSFIVNVNYIKSSRPFRSAK